MIDVLSFSGRCRSSSLLFLRTLRSVHGRASDKRVTALDISRLDPTHLLEDPDCVPGERLLEELVEPSDDPSLPAVEKDEALLPRLSGIYRRMPVLAGDLNDVMDRARSLFRRLRANEPALVAILEVLVSILEVLVSVRERRVAQFSPLPEASGLISLVTVVAITPPPGVINCAGRGGAFHGRSARGPQPASIFRVAPA